MKRRFEIPLSPPHMGPHERELLLEAFDSNWIAPLGPHVDAFEAEVARLVGVDAALAVSSGTAGIHLALHLAGVGAGDEVLVSSLTFAATVNPIRYLGGTPVFVDSEARSWNLDVNLVAAHLDLAAKRGRLPRAVLAVDLYGQTAALSDLTSACDRHGVALIEDAAEALGADHLGKPAGTWGRCGIYSFNGNKVITASGGGMIVSNDRDLVARARKLATQAREPAPHYEHADVGFNYRMSNLLAAVGRGQLRELPDRVAARRRNFEHYRELLSRLPGIDFMPDAGWGTHSRWLTTLTIDPLRFGADRETVRLALESEGIEARPLWKPMHLQPVFRGYPSLGGAVAEALFRTGLCLPSGSALGADQRVRVASVVTRCCR